MIVSLASTLVQTRKSSKRGEYAGSASTVQAWLELEESARVSVCAIRANPLALPAVYHFKIRLR